MVVVETSSGYTYEIPDKLPPGPVYADAIVSGTTQLNTIDGDGVHLVLHGTLGVGDKYILCQDDNGVEKMSVDPAGYISAYDIRTENYQGGLDSEMTELLDQVVETVGEVESMALHVAKIEAADEARANTVSTNPQSVLDNHIVKRATGSEFTEINLVD